MQSPPVQTSSLVKSPCEHQQNHTFWYRLEAQAWGCCNSRHKVLAAASWRKTNVPWTSSRHARVGNHPRCRNVYHTQQVPNTHKHRGPGCVIFAPRRTTQHSNHCTMRCLPVCVIALHSCACCVCPAPPHPPPPRPTPCKPPVSSAIVHTGAYRYVCMMMGPHPRGHRHIQKPVPAGSD